MLSLALTQELTSPRGLERERVFPTPGRESSYVCINTQSKNKAGGAGVIVHTPEEGVGLKQSLLRNIINTKKNAKRCFGYEVTLMSANPLSLNQQPETSQSW